MSLKLNFLTAVAAVALASPVLAQDQTTTTETPPGTTTTESTTTTQPTTTPATPSTTQTTTTEPTTTPEGQPATTTQTTTTETLPTTTPEGQAATTTQTTTTETQVTAATAADLKAGASVYDQIGGLVGKIDSADDKGAVVNTGKARAEIPIASFGKNDKGLVVTITKAEIDAQAKAEKPASTEKPKT